MKRFVLIISVIMTVSLFLSGCGKGADLSLATAVQPAPEATMSMEMNHSNNSSNQGQPLELGKAPDVKQAYFTFTVLPQGKLGPDGQLHDAFSPSDLTLLQGVPIQISICNYDPMDHNLISTTLGLNIEAKGAAQKGVARTTTVNFTPQKAGDFTWICSDPCDDFADGWAMRRDGYMKGTIHVVAQ